MRHTSTKSFLRNGSCLPRIRSNLKQKWMAVRDKKAWWLIRCEGGKPCVNMTKGYQNGGQMLHETRTELPALLLFGWEKLYNWHICWAKICLVELDLVDEKECCGNGLAFQILSGELPWVPQRILSWICTSASQILSYENMIMNGSYNPKSECFNVIMLANVQGWKHAWCNQW